MDKKDIKILIVDDDKSMLALLENGLQKGGYETIKAESGDAAIEILKSFTPELIIADVMMPGMNGYELCRKIRASGFNEIPFIFCSSLGKPNERIRGLWIGADDYVVKPVNLVELLLKVEKLIEKSDKFRRLAEKAKSDGSNDIMSGNIQSIKPPELLQILTLIGLPHLRFHLERADGTKGELFIEKNMLLHASFGACEGMKALCRIVSSKEGRYSVDSKKWEQPPKMKGHIEEMLFEAAVQNDEFNLLYGQLKESGSSLKIAQPPDVSNFTSSPHAATVIEIAGRESDLDRTIESSPLPDIETVKVIMEAIATGAVTIS